jgi:hypothetical protein
MLYDREEWAGMHTKWPELEAEMINGFSDLVSFAQPLKHTSELIQA